MNHVTCTMYVINMSLEKNKNIADTKRATSQTTGNVKKERKQISNQEKRKKMKKVPRASNVGNPVILPENVQPGFQSMIITRTR